MAFKPVLIICILAFLGVTNAFAQAVPDSGTMVPADSVATVEPAAGDSGAVLEQAVIPTPDSIMGADSLATVEDSLAAAQPDSIAAKPDSAAAPAEEKPAKPVRRGNDEIVGEVIPWDWDDFTNVTEVGVRTKPGREYALDKNEMYQKIFDHFLGLELRLFGDARRDDDGFYFFRVDEFEMADSTAKPPVKLP